MLTCLSALPSFLVEDRAPLNGSAEAEAVTGALLRLLLWSLCVEFVPINTGVMPLCEYTLSVLLLLFLLPSSSSVLSVLRLASLVAMEKVKWPDDCLAVVAFLLRVFHDLYRALLWSVP